MREPGAPEPTLLEATTIAESEIGSCEWNSDHNTDLLTVSNNGQSIGWGPRKPEYEGKHYPPAWVPASTRLHLHSGQYQWDYVVVDSQILEKGRATQSIVLTHET